MVHKILIDGTAYEISGGKTLIDSTAYEIDKGKTLVDGTAYEIGFSRWADDLDTGLEFTSTNPFTIWVASPEWDGTMEYCSGEEGWKTWDGSEISSSESKSGQCIYMRGTGNTVVSYGDGFILNGDKIECNGNIENLLDYSSVKAGIHPVMGAVCFARLFRDCVALITAPSLPATVLAENCYMDMFDGCENLTTLPSLPATVLPNRCYSGMFERCSSIKLSNRASYPYVVPYRIPAIEDCEQAEQYALLSMFGDTGGTFKGTPKINTMYYLDESNTIV